MIYFFLLYNKKEFDLFKKLQILKIIKITHS